MSDIFEPKFGYIPPPEPRFGSVPAWADKNEVLPESEWREHDDHANEWPQIEAQRNNNCTNASIAMGVEALFKVSGIEAPRFSWSSNYARHNGGRDQGAFCRDLAMDFLTVGLCPAALWPDSKIYGNWTAEQLRAAEPWKGLEVYQCMSFAEVASALSRGFIVYHGFVLGNGGVSNPRDGRMPEYDGQFSNGHAMVSRGLTKRFGDWRTITPNTWGTGWADRGIGYWPRSYWWVQSGNKINLEAFCFRAPRLQADQLPKAA